jgi:hypothetical protein
MSAPGYLACPPPRQSANLNTKPDMYCLLRQAAMGPAIAVVSRMLMRTPTRARQESLDQAGKMPNRD